MVRFVAMGNSFNALLKNKQSSSSSSASNMLIGATCSLVIGTNKSNYSNKQRSKYAIPYELHVYSGLLHNLLILVKWNVIIGCIRSRINSNKISPGLNCLYHDGNIQV